VAAGIVTYYVNIVHLLRYTAAVYPQYSNVILSIRSLAQAEIAKQTRIFPFFDHLRENAADVKNIENNKWHLFGFP